MQTGWYLGPLLVVLKQKSKSLVKFKNTPSSAPAVLSTCSPYSYWLMWSHSSGPGMERLMGLCSVFVELIFLLSCVSRSVMSDSFASSWTVANQAPLSLGFSRQECQSGLPFPSPVHACMLSHFSCVQFCVTLWTAAHQAPLSTGLSRQEWWSGLPFNVFDVSINGIFLKLYFLIWCGWYK